MNKRRAYEEVTIAHGDHAVTLRPSLRAAAVLEDKFGFPIIERGLTELDFTIVSEIILAASLARQDAAAFLSSLPGRPLSPFFEAVIAPLSDLVRMFVPAPVQPLNTAQRTTGKPVTWTDFYADQYKKATGWLGWTPETAWNATPTEIDRAYAAHMEKLKGIHGSGEDDKQQHIKTEPDADLADRLKADGIDPEFDRAALRALKAKIAGDA